MPFALMSLSVYHNTLLLASSESYIVTSNEKDISRRRETRSQKNEGSIMKKGRVRLQDDQRRQRQATVAMEARGFPRAMLLSTAATSHTWSGYLEGTRLKLECSKYKTHSRCVRNK